MYPGMPGYLGYKFLKDFRELIRGIIPVSHISTFNLYSYIPRILRIHRISYPNSLIYLYIL
jgi:hypothetical protein